MPTTTYVTNAQADVPDSRDWAYQPALVQLKDSLDPPDGLRVLDQKSEGACTGFALAAVINQLYSQAGQDTEVSARMLYEMAKRHDEWPGEEYDGSSLRGAIHGWKNMGVCRDDVWPYRVGRRRVGELTIRRARDARKHTIGAYYRVQPQIADFHAALNETGAIAVSARVHRGWNRPVDGIIQPQSRITGGHAFAVVGYNADGFWVQNSWGKGWGDQGLALWRYEDWVENVMDAWVFRLALPTPQIFGMNARSARAAAERTELGKPAVNRATIAGHFVHIDDGRYHASGRYWSTAEDIEQTAAHVASKKRYKHLLIYCHGGLNSPKASARRVAAMKQVFKANGIYPFHIMYDTGVVEELKDLIVRKENNAQDRVGGFSDWADRFIEGLLRRPGTLLWDEMKQDAQDAFAQAGAGTDALLRFRHHLEKQQRKIKLHLVGHSTGAIVIAHLLRTLRRRKLVVDSCSLLAPACSLDLYEAAYLPVLRGRTAIRMKDLTIYNLRDRLEQDDHVAKVYRKSLLYLVSNAFEGDRGKPLLGMERFAGDIEKAGALPEIVYSNGADGRRSRSRSHGGFDNDPHTMNDILKRMLNARPERPFSADDLDY